SRNKSLLPCAIRRAGLHSGRSRATLSRAAWLGDGPLHGQTPPCPSRYEDRKILALHGGESGGIRSALRGLGRPDRAEESEAHRMIHSSDLPRVKGLRMSRKRGEGEGSLKKDGNIWKGRWVEWVDGKQKRPKTSFLVGKFPSKREAREELNRIIRER